MTEPKQQMPRKGAGTEEVRRRASARKIAAEREAKRRRILQAVGAAVLALLVIGGLVWVLNRQKAIELQAAEPIPDGIALEGRVMGDPNAPVKIVEYGDFQCPHCGTFHKTVEPMIVDDYVKTGKASFEFRDYAFIGPESRAAAEAATCAQDQGKFWPFHNLLFANQGKGENEGAFGSDRLKAMAAKLGLDTGAFNSCLDGGTHKAAVEQSIKDAQAKGVDSTPTIFVNDVEAPFTKDGLKEAIDKAVAGS